MKSAGDGPLHTSQQVACCLHYCCRLQVVQGVCRQYSARSDNTAHCTSPEHSCCSEAFEKQLCPHPLRIATWLHHESFDSGADAIANTSGYKVNLSCLESATESQRLHTGHVCSCMPAMQCKTLKALTGSFTSSSTDAVWAPAACSFS